MEPDRRFFGKRNLFPVFVRRIPGIMTLLLAVHQSIAETADFVALEKRKDREIIGTFGAGHPFRTQDGAVELLEQRDVPAAVLIIPITMERDDVAVGKDERLDG